MQKSITQIVAEKPDQIVQFADDFSAKGLLLEIGIIAKFSEVPRPPGFTGGYANAVGYSDHSTHWIIGFLYSGYEKEVDNGYCAFAFPKTQFTREEVMKRVREQLSTGGGIHKEKMVASRPPQN